MRSFQNDCATSSNRAADAAVTLARQSLPWAIRNVRMVAAKILFHGKNDPVAPVSTLLTLLRPQFPPCLVLEVLQTMYLRDLLYRLLSLTS